VPPQTTRMGASEFPAAGIFLERLENGNPDSGNAAGDGNALAAHQAKNAFRIDARTGEDQARAKHSAGIRQAPGVGMEHGSDRRTVSKLLMPKTSPRPHAKECRTNAR